MAKHERPDRQERELKEDLNPEGGPTKKKSWRSKLGRYWKSG